MSYSNSIGWVYSRVTDLLSFIPSKEEHKTQWLGLEGQPVYKDIFLRVLRRPGEVFPKLDLRYFRRNLTGGFVPSSFLFDRLGLPSEESEFTTTQKRNLASSVQAAITELISDLLASFQKKTGLQQICLGGDVFHKLLWSASLAWGIFSFRPLPATQDMCWARPPGFGISRWASRATRKSALCIGGPSSRAQKSRTSSTM
jgi:predicted NodU family carbamoyl transferase